MNEQLKPCPFCGGESQPESIHGGQAFYVECTECEVETPAESTFEKAITAWNRRPEPAQLTPEMAAAIEVLREADLAYNPHDGQLWIGLRSVMATPNPNQPHHDKAVAVLGAIATISQSEVNEDDA
jgi:Lar family restriction alleviation protein